MDSQPETHVPEHMVWVSFNQPECLNLM